MNSVSDFDAVNFAISSGKFAIVDFRDIEWLSRNKWSYWANKQKTSGYAARVKMQEGERIKVTMHREVFFAHSDLNPIDCAHLDIDHINGNKLDNRFENLRIANRQQNSGNRGRNRQNKSGYKGVNLHDTDRMVWRAQIMDNGKKRSIGYFATAEEAALAYNAEAVKVFGEFAFLNTVEGVTEFKPLVYKTSKDYVSKGVSFNKRLAKWMAYAKVDGKRVHIGYYTTEEDAIHARSTFIEVHEDKAA